MNCYAFMRYNSQTLYGFGSEEEAEKYSNLLNKGRVVNFYNYCLVEDEALVRALTFTRDDAVNLEDALFALTTPFESSQTD